MPNKLLKAAIAECASPLVMVMLSQGEVASRRTELRAFTDGTFTTVTNVPKLFSMVDGSELSLIENANAREIANDEFDTLNDLVTMKSSESDQIIGIDNELAFAIAGEEVFCPITGKAGATMSYVDTEQAADGEGSEELQLDGDDSSSEEDISDIDDSLDGDDNDDDSSGGDDEEDDFLASDDGDDDTSDGDEESDAMDLASFGTKARALLPKTAIRVSVYETADATSPAVDGNLVNVVNDDTFVVADENGSNFTVKATDVSDGESSVKLVGKANSIESATVKVTVAETVNPEDSAIRLVNLSGEGNSEIAVFVADKHIGTMYRTKASEKAADLFTKGTALFQAFKPTLLQHYAEQASPELSKFGYVPNTLDIQVGELFNRRLQREVAAHNNKAEIASAERIGDMTSNIELAFVGLNKGLLKGNNDLVVAIASDLRRAGVQRPERRARELLAKHSTGYVKSAIEHAKDFSTKSAEYLNGLTVTLANADFVVTENEDSNITDISTSMISTEKKPAPVAAPESETAGFSESEKPASNRYQRLFRGLR